MQTAAFNVFRGLNQVHVPTAITSLWRFVGFCDVQCKNHEMGLVGLG